MPIKTPKFWLQKNFISKTLLPLSFVYQAFAQYVEKLQKPEIVSMPVICVGNITLGGSGKTPVALAIGKILQELDVEFSFLSRGYFGKKNQFGFVDKNRSISFDVGDEPLILADLAPTFVAKDRVLGAKEIAKNRKFQAIVLDDGMQNNSIKKDLTILVIDGKIKFGNGFLFPAGPLRESIEDGCKKADLVVVVGNVDEELQKNLAQKKIILAKIKAKNLNNFQDKKLVAFCGLAYPDKFFSFLDSQELDVVDRCNFMDHHLYKISELDNLIRLAKKNKAKLITTKKDWVKFPLNYKRKIEYLDIELEFENKDLVVNELKRVLRKTSKSKK